MRRVLFCLFAVSFLGNLTGCHLLHSHGVCDCEVDDYCSSRAPWVRHHHFAPLPEVVPAPTPVTPDKPKQL